MSADHNSPEQLSLCMIVRDEEFFIADCLRAARPHVDEIIVVDTGSTDRTPQLAAEHADIVETFEWSDDFSAARNFSLDLATGQWVLVLDADELIAPDGYERIRQLMKEGAGDGYMLSQASYGDEPGPQRHPVASDDPYARGHRWVSTLPILRLFKASPEIRFAGRVHEIVDDSISPERTASAGVTIHHYAHGNPQRPRSERVSRYLKLLEDELAEQEDGRKFGIAAASCMALGDDYRKAADYYISAARLGYRVRESMEGAGIACYMGGNTDMAHLIFNDLYDQGFRSVSNCLNLANLEVRKSNVKRAAALLEEVLLMPELTADKRERVQHNLAALTGS